MDNSPDYTKYSENELVDVTNNMDAARYPERFANAQSELKRRRKAEADCEKPAHPPIVLTPQEKRKKALFERTLIKELFNRGAYYQIIKRKAPKSYLGLLFLPLLFSVLSGT